MYICCVLRIYIRKEENSVSVADMKMKMHCENCMFEIKRRDYEEEKKMGVFISAIWYLIFTNGVCKTNCETSGWQTHHYQCVLRPDQGVLYCL